MSIKSIVRKIYHPLNDVVQEAKASYYDRRTHQMEINKFRDPRRVAIANQYLLSKEQKEQIDELYITNYGEKVDYIWHQNFAAHAGRFDYRFFPELLFIPEFEAYQNQNSAIVRLLSDKNFLPLLAKGLGMKMPRTIVDCTNGVLRDGEHHIITSKMALEILNRCNAFFIKPTLDSCSGVGCLKVEGNAKITIGSNTIVVNGKRYSHDFVVQELIKCHESICRLYPSAVNTFRIITYLWHDKIFYTPVVLRIGRGGNYVDNAHAGGMFVAVDENGMLCNHAVTEFNDKFEIHPDTGIRFKGYKIEHFREMLYSVIRLHEGIPQIGCVNWDATIDADGNPIIVEANTRGGSIWLPQMAHGVGPFGERTEEVLQWLRFMKGLKSNQRIRYSAGRMG